MSVRSAAREFAGEPMDLFNDRGEGESGQVRRVGGRLLGPGQSAEPERFIVAYAEDIGDSEDAGRLRGAGLFAPVVDGGAADFAALGEPGLGLALLGEGGLDEVEESAGGGVVAHSSMCTEMTRVVVPFSLPLSGKTCIELARVGKRMKGVSDLYLSPTQACGRLNISPPTLLKRIRAGEIEAIKLGDARNSPVKVLLSSIEKYEERRQMARAGAAA